MKRCPLFGDCWIDTAMVKVVSTTGKPQIDFFFHASKFFLLCGQSQGIYIEGSFACFMSWDFVCIFLACFYVKPLNTVIDVID